MNSGATTMISNHAAIAHGGGDAQAALYEQIHRAVQQLVLAALAQARQQGAPAGLPPPAAGAAVYPHAAVWTRLSTREREVLQRIAAGESNKAIARALDLSLHTVKRHVANILDKLGAPSRGHAAAAWLRAHS
jgi:LuxR family maltose regulon positive regulatory protein